MCFISSALYDVISGESFRENIKRSIMIFMTLLGHGERGRRLEEDLTVFDIV